MTSALKKTTVHIWGPIMGPILSWGIQGWLPLECGSETSHKSRCYQEKNMGKESQAEAAACTKALRLEEARCLRG